MIELIKLALKSLIMAADAWKDFVEVRKAEARLEWAQALQKGLEPLEQGVETTDEQKIAALKAVANAWKNMPS